MSTYKEGDKVYVECVVRGVDRDGDVRVYIPDPVTGGGGVLFDRAYATMHRDYVKPKPDMSPEALTGLEYDLQKHIDPIWSNDEIMEEIKSASIQQLDEAIIWLMVLRARREAF